MTSRAKDGRRVGCSAALLTTETFIVLGPYRWLPRLLLAYILMVFTVPSSGGVWVAAALSILAA